MTTMSNHKVMHVCFSPSWGGLEKNLFDLALAQKNAGHDILFVCGKGFSIEREVKKTGIPCVSYSNIAAYIDLRVMASMRRIIKSQNFKIVHATYSKDLGLIVPAIAGLGDVKLFFTLQMNQTKDKKDIYHRWEYGRMSKMFVSSPILRQAVIKYLPIAEDDVMVVPYGIDLQIYKPIRDEAFRAGLGFKPDTIVLGILARLDPPKGQMEAIQAMPAILKKHPSARLMFVGDESVEHKGEVVKRLKGEVARLALGDAVKFVGDQRGAEQAKYLNAMDIFLSPSYFETYSTSMIMAQLCAIPVIGTNAGGTPEQLGYGKYGKIVEPRDSASLAMGILETLNNMVDAKKRAEEMHLIAVERFDMKKIVERIEAEYGKALKGDLTSAHL